MYSLVHNLSSALKTSLSWEQVKMQREAWTVYDYVMLTTRTLMREVLFSVSNIHVNP